MNLKERWGVLTEVKTAPVPKLTPELMIKINAVYEKLSSRKGFPTNYCGPAMQELRRLGFQGIRGFFQVGRSGDLDLLLDHSHDWAEDAGGKIIDLTAAQYNREKSLGAVIPSGVLIIDKENPLYERYIILERLPTRPLFPTPKDVFSKWKVVLLGG
ncbi:MAG: hypothetical protein Q7R31_01735 [Candidatus Levybacteria bacterium]|nr:hypothetical protein [Candidatus Levybacteria bacterium]